MSTKDLFPYVAELALEEILSNTKIQDSLLGRFGIKTGDVKVCRQVELKFPAAKGQMEINFAQQAKIALAFFLEDSNELIPLEIKTGFSELEAYKIRKYKPCGHDQANRTVNGKMLAVLARKFTADLLSEIGARKLCGIVDGHAIPLSEEWGIIARQAVIEGWESTQPKDFLSNAKFFAIEDICTNFGETEFNEIVRNLLCHNRYFADWSLQK